MEALRSTAVNAYEGRIAERIRARFPRIVEAHRWDDDAVRHLARRAIDLCLSHGVERACDIRTVVDCLLTMSVPADALKVLARDDLPGDAKAALLHDLVVFVGA
jgi:hypothetical protein